MIPSITTGYMVSAPKDIVETYLLFISSTDHVAGSCVASLAYAPLDHQTQLCLCVL
jgi:hypothetical protein